MRPRLRPAERLRDGLDGQKRDKAAEPSPAQPQKQKGEENRRSDVSPSWREGSGAAAFRAAQPLPGRHLSSWCLHSPAACCRWHSNMVAGLTARAGMGWGGGCGGWLGAGGVVMGCMGLWEGGAYHLVVVVAVGNVGLLEKGAQGGLWGHRACVRRDKKPQRWRRAPKGAKGSPHTASLTSSMLTGPQSLADPPGCQAHAP